MHNQSSPAYRIVVMFKHHRGRIPPEAKFYWVVPFFWIALIALSARLTFQSIPHLKNDDFSWCCLEMAETGGDHGSFENCAHSKSHLRQNSERVGTLQSHAAMSFSLYVFGFMLLVLCGVFRFVYLRCGKSVREAWLPRNTNFFYYIFCIGMLVYTVGASGFATPVLEAATDEINDRCFPSAFRSHLWSNWDRAKILVWTLPVLATLIVLVETIVNELHAQRMASRYYAASRTTSDEDDISPEEAYADPTAPLRQRPRTEKEAEE